MAQGLQRAPRVGPGAGQALRLRAVNCRVIASVTKKMDVAGGRRQSIEGTACMTFTVEIADSVKLQRLVAGLAGVRSARRR